MVNTFYSESDLLPISGLQHIVFCKRQCALIHIERMWEENRLTAEGRILHDKTHEEEEELRGATKICRGLKLRNLEIGIYGVADVVEIHYKSPTARTRNDIESVIPIEYKRGKEKEDYCDSVQLCAQAMCLEEMLNRKIDCGQLFYGATRRRLDVSFAPDLREFTKETTREFHLLIKNGLVPQAKVEKKCKSCSLVDLCIPELVDTNHKSIKYVNSIFEECQDETSA